ncbi:hypothetical protein FHG87_004802 [Trinorchestia longiramus]|nr:hypothetical protein FHG87_004802 [Trinorchestia longiramus]
MAALALLASQDSLYGSMGDHNGSQVALIIINSIVFAIATVLVHLWAFPQYAGGLFLNELRNMTLIYELPVTPEPWVVILWSVTMAWLFVCEIYAFVLVCLKTSVGPAYKSPPVLGPWFLLNFTMGLFCLIAWFIVWDRDLMVASTVLIILAAVFCWIATAAIYNTVYQYGGWMARHSRVLLWFYRLLWHNGMAGFTTWLTIQAIYSLVISLRIEAGISLQNTVWGVLGAMAGIMVFWCVMELTFLDRYGRYTVTPYLIVMVHMVGVFTRHVDQDNISSPTDIFIVVLLAAAALFLLLRILLGAIRGFKCPLYANNKVGEDPVISFAS